jgi:hypothetical protein
MTPIRTNIVGPPNSRPASGSRSRLAIPRCPLLFFGSLVAYVAASSKVTRLRPSGSTIASSKRRFQDNAFRAQPQTMGIVKSSGWGERTVASSRAKGVPRRGTQQTEVVDTYLKLDDALNRADASVFATGSDWRSDVVGEGRDRFNDKLNGISAETDTRSATLRKTFIGI